MQTLTLRSVIDNDGAPRRTATPSNIRAARAAGDLSATDLACLIGVRERTVERWENGTCAPQRAARLRLERFVAVFVP